MKNFYLTLVSLFCFALGSFAQVPKLSSYPSAQAVLFLDFDGHTVEGTSWNYEGPIVCNSANVNATQLTEIFHRVAEDYRPFNINVTTDSTLYAAAPAKKRMRIVLTTSSSWYGSAGGVSFTNSFSWGDNTPCFVFTALLNYNVKNIAEAASHEAGHTLGLNHQSSYDASCGKTAEYNAGTGSGEIGWAPIMGVGYYRNLTLWHYGSNPYGCSYMQDDLGIITNARNGFGFRADDYENTQEKAAAVSFVNHRIAVSGLIERPTDADMFTFTLNSPKKIQIAANPFSVASGYVGANVDLQLEIINAAQNQTVMYNPENTVHVSVDSLLPAGTYYLRIAGSGNAFTPNYASLGLYELTVNEPYGTLPLHKLELKAKAENNRHQLSWEIVADERVVEQTIETATDGSNFQPLSGVSTSARNYAHLPAKSNLLYYRVKVMFDNGRTHYSNIATLHGNESNSKPYLIGNMITSTMTISSPSNFAYTILDMSGRQVGKGRLTQGLNSVSVSQLTGGMFILQYTNQQEQYTEKFMKR